MFEPQKYKRKAVNHISYMIKKESDEHIQFNLRWKPRPKKNMHFHKSILKSLSSRIFGMFGLENFFWPIALFTTSEVIAILHWNWAHQDTRSRFD